MKASVVLSALILFLLFTPVSRATTDTGKLVAAEGDPIGNTGLTLSQSGPPAIAANETCAFRATITGTGVNGSNNTVILFYSGTNGTVVARTGTSDGIIGGKFIKLTDPVLSGSGQLAFIGTLATSGTSITASNDQGIYVYQSGTLSLAARKGQVDGKDFTVPVSFASFNQVNIDDSGGIFFLGNVTGKGVSSPALVGTLTSGSLRIVAIQTSQDTVSSAFNFHAFQVLPLAGGQSRTVDEVNGNVAVYGDLVSPNFVSLGIATNGTSDFDRFAEQFVGGPGPITGSKITSLGEPAINANGTWAFQFSAAGTSLSGSNNSGVAVSSSTDNYIVQTGSDAPDESGSATGTVFAKLSAPVLSDSDAIAFVGTLKTSGTTVTASTNSGIWSNWTGTLERVARTGDAAPNTSGTFSAFSQIALADFSGPVFLAQLKGVPASANMGVWANRASGFLARVVYTGDQVMVHGQSKTIKTISVFQNVPYCGGQTRSIDPILGEVVVLLTFTDKTWAVFETNIPI